MRTAGVLVSVTSKRPSALVVVLDGNDQEQRLVEDFRLTTMEKEPAAQAHDLSTNFRNRLKGLEVERVMIRRADLPPRASNKEGPRLRLIMEGALAGAARDQVPAASILAGKDIAALTAMKKSQLDEVAGERFGPELAQAAAAAMAAMH